MDRSQFDALARSLSGPRRWLLGAGILIATSRFGGSGVTAKKRKKRKKRTKKRQVGTPNAFGCLEVGDFCQSAGQCCSGGCRGKRGKKTCRAHGTGTCEQGGLDHCSSPQPACNSSASCGCLLTTAGSNFCGALLAPSDCADCRTDRDCELLGFPTGSACAPYATGGCAGICNTGMACFAPCGTEMPPTGP